MLKFESAIIRCGDFIPTNKKSKYKDDQVDQEVELKPFQIGITHLTKIAVPRIASEADDLVRIYRVQYVREAKVQGTYNSPSPFFVQGGTNCSIL